MLRLPGPRRWIIFNQGDTPLREGLIVGTLPARRRCRHHPRVVGASFADGAALAAGRLDRLHRGAASGVAAAGERDRRELPGANNNNVVMAGAHLDSVRAGPGINDNGSGSAALLETAQQLAHLKPQNTLRFAWWGAEERGPCRLDRLRPNGLSGAEKDRIALYMNYDMVGSPNYIFMTQDADQSIVRQLRVPVPPGSDGDRGPLRVLLHADRASRTTTQPFSGRSDYQAFINVGIPSGGLFTGAEVIKTEEQEDDLGRHCG